MSRIGYALSYLIWMIGEIISGSLAVVRVALGPSGQVAPSILEVPLRCRTDVEIITYASSITITPGTLVVGTAHGTAERPPTLFVHVLQTASRDEAMAGLREMEDRLLRVTRGREGADAPPHIHHPRLNANDTAATQAPADARAGSAGSEHHTLPPPENQPEERENRA